MDAAQWPKVLEYDFHKMRDFQVISPTEGSGDSSSKQEKNNKKSRAKKRDEVQFYEHQILLLQQLQPKSAQKACRRYWTHGGTLRNVPVGGSSRKKNKSLLPHSDNRLFLHLNPKPITTMSSNFSALDDLNIGLYHANAHHFELSHGALSPNVSMCERIYPSAACFHFQDMTLNLCMDMEGAGRPFGEVKQVSAGNKIYSESSGILYWNNNHGLYN